MQGLELIYVTVIGAVITVAVRYLVPGRSTHGVLLLPAIGAAVSAVAWVGFTWLGLKPDGGWIWLVSLGAAAIAGVVVAVLLRRIRSAADDRRLHVLSGGKA